MIINLTELYTKNHAKLLRKVKKLTNNPSNAEDIVQDTFLEALTKIDKYDSTKASMTTWLNKLLMANIWKYFRGKKKEPLFVDVLDCFLEDENFDKERMTLHNVLEKVSNKLHRDVLVAKLVYGYTYEEVSNLFDIKQANARKIVYTFKSSL